MKRSSLCASCSLPASDSANLSVDFTRNLVIRSFIGHHCVSRSTALEQQLPWAVAEAGANRFDSVLI